MARISRFFVVGFLAVSLMFTGCGSIKKNKGVQLLGAAVLMGAIAQDTEATTPEKMNNGSFDNRSKELDERAATKNI